MHSEGVLDHAPQVLAAYLKVLEALAVSESGARAMFTQLQVEGMNMLSWNGMLHVIVQCCDRYAHYQEHQVVPLPPAKLILSLSSHFCPAGHKLTWQTSEWMKLHLCPFLGEERHCLWMCRILPTRPD